MIHEEELDPIEQLFRQESADLEEMPSAEAWQKLQKKLSTAPRKSRRPVPLFLSVSAVVLALLLLAGAAAWYVAHMHATALNHRRAQIDLQFLAGNWQDRAGKATHNLSFIATPDGECQGYETIYMRNDTLGHKNWHLYMSKNRLYLDISDEIYHFETQIGTTLIFKNKSGSPLKIRYTAADKFTLSFGNGMIFTFRRL